ncbi:MAG TPA: PAS domain S-box protein, partial [Luteolibacter sp.]
MLENISLIAMTLDATGTVTFCNDCLLEITGWSQEEVVGSEWWPRFTPGDPRAKQRYLEIIATGKVPAHRENSIMTRDGRLRDIAWNNSLLRDSEGTIIGAAYIGEDVTERNRALERIREQAAMLDQAHEAIIDFDIHTRRVTYWNHGAERLYGRTSADAKGREIGPLIFADPAMADTITEHLLAAGEWRGECRQLTESGRELIANAHATLMRDAAGMPKSALVINIDITAQKQLEEQLLRSQRMEGIGTLACGIANDFNNVLAPIMMAVGVLKTRLPDPASQELLAILTASARRGADMIRQILFVGAGVGGPRQIEVNLKHLLLEIDKIANDTFLKQVQVRVNVPDDLRTVTGDPTQLHQVLLNLCVNAREAMPEGGTLT